MINGGTWLSLFLTFSSPSFLLFILGFIHFTAFYIQLGGLLSNEVSLILYVHSGDQELRFRMNWTFAEDHTLVRRPRSTTRCLLIIGIYVFNIIHLLPHGLESVVLLKFYCSISSVTPEKAVGGALVKRLHGQLWARFCFFSEDILSDWTLLPLFIKR